MVLAEWNNLTCVLCTYHINKNPIAVDVLFKAYPMVPLSCRWPDGTFKGPVYWRCFVLFPFRFFVFAGFWILRKSFKGVEPLSAGLVNLLSKRIRETGIYASQLLSKFFQSWSVLQFFAKTDFISYFLNLRSVFRIGIHLIRIRIQHFRLQLTKKYFFDQKLQFPIPRPP